uniref:Methyltransferase domain-containing protein n=1 Tax=Candidatus Kentrum sp. LPFa TaxID=2126335 RepID=A0A450WM79_9GAMM|nr:MAG: Methyltransferase domain-containing protein [Candidatus Kentron sp. LPFa]
MSEKTIDHFCSSTYYRLFSLFNRYDKKLVHVLKSLLGFEPNRILDLACGVGLSTLVLRDNFPGAKITGIDIDPDLIEFARERASRDGIEFRCAEIPDMLAEIPNNTIDLIFIKSAYHYFDEQITIAHLKPLLRERGVIGIAERTARSAKSYPLPNIASTYWEGIFSGHRPNRRLYAADASEMTLSVSCLGEHVMIPTDIYLDAVKENQLVGLWLLKPEVVDEWINNQVTQEIDAFRVFEEFWLYLYRKNRLIA